MKVGKSWINNRGYRRLKIDGKTKHYSHYIWFQNTGYWPDWENKREIIHHINDDRLDDRFKNLQIMTNNEHMRLHRNEWLKTHKHNHLGTKLSEEHKKKISEGLKNYYQTTGGDVK